MTSIFVLSDNFDPKSFINLILSSYMCISILYIFANIHEYTLYIYMY